MSREIRSLRTEGARRVRAALSALRSNPEEYDSLLESHFNTDSGNRARLRTIRARLGETLRALEGDRRVEYLCRDRADRMCARHRRRAASENCSSGSTADIWFCAHYDGSPYFAGDHWLKTFIHEHVHAGCRRIGGIDVGNEVYQGHEGHRYPPSASRAVRNADSYAWFAMEFDR